MGLFDKLFRGNTPPTQLPSTPNHEAAKKAPTQLVSNFPKIEYPEQEALNKTPEHIASNEMIDFGSASIASENHPSWNEDASFISPDGKSFGVLDGVGGRSAGNVASETARNYLATAMKDFREGLSLAEAKEKMEQLLGGVGDAVYEKAQTENGKYAGMLTTACFAKLWTGPNGETRAIIANNGDSRAYVLRANGKLDSITVDHGQVLQMWPEEENRDKARSIQERLGNVATEADFEQLSDWEKIVYRSRNGITQAAGVEVSLVDVCDTIIHPGDKILLSSDGIHDNLTHKEIAAILASAGNANEAVKKLTQASLTRSRDTEHIRAKADDMTAVVIEFGKAADQEIFVVPEEEPIYDITEKDLAWDNIITVVPDEDMDDILHRIGR